MALPLLSVAMALTEFVPWLAGKLGGDNAEAVADKVVAVARNVVNERLPDGMPLTDEGVLARLREDKAAQFSFKMAVLENAQEIDKLYFADTQSARERDVRIREAGGTNKRGNWLAVLAIGVVATILLIVVWEANLPEYTKGVLTLILGRFLGYIEQIYNFEYGTTRTSRLKDETIDNLSKK